VEIHIKVSRLIDQFQRARGDSELAVIEGVQALKHTARFQAEFIQVITSDQRKLAEYLAELAPDVQRKLLNQAIEVNQEVFKQLSPQPPRTQAIAIANRRKYQLEDIERERPMVLLEDPRDLENIGAVIRVAAAANAAAVCVTGPVDVWHPGVIRGSAGLIYALPVLNVASIDTVTNHMPSRRLVSLDPTGKELSDCQLVPSDILVFGTERHGIQPATLKQSDAIVRLPMQPGVSSLNLATSVAATLYQPMLG